MRNRSLLSLVPILALALGACSDTGTEPVDGPQFTHDPTVLSALIDDSKPGQPVCMDYAGEFDPPLLGLFDFASGKVDTDNDPSSITVSEDGYLVAAICYKAGTNVVIIDLVDDPQEEYTFSHQRHAISHFVVYYVKSDIPDQGVWCSPGYWRNADDKAWEDAGISKDYKYLDPTEWAIWAVTPANLKGTSAANDPTLYQVLLNPNVYGGAAFNSVGDLLSAAHPDVDFMGERVADSCPINNAGEVSGE
jgi:hypothetical protein